MPSTSTASSFAAFAAATKKEALQAFSYEPAPLGPHDVEIQITHCGICHSDIHLIDDDWSRSRYPLVPGHEIVGAVVSKGAASTHAVGARVGVGWQRSACLACEQCLSGNENLCAAQTATCVGHHGGFADRIRTDGRFAFALPASLDSATAAPLLCGGATVFAPLRRYGVGANSAVGVVGIGGLGHIALRFLEKMGAEVTAFSSSPDKREESLRLGAHHACSSTDAHELKKLFGSLDLILCTAPARLDWITYMQVLKPGGTLCLVGAPPGLIQIPVSQLLSGQKGVAGSDIGSRAAITEMLEFAAKHAIGAQVETKPLAEVNLALDRLRKNEVRYRMVLVN
jgi:uncharacterized zinc-type alcohol dehydrogenase-like protein